MTSSVHYRVDGPSDAPAVLLSAGLGTTLHLWDPQMAALTRHFRVVRYDHRGHGASVAGEPYTVEAFAVDAVELLDQLGVDRAHVVGISLGGMVAQRLAIDAPDRVDGVVLISTGARLGSAQHWAERARMAREDGTAALAPTVVPRWFTPAFQERDPSTVQDVVDMLAATTDDGYAGCAAAVGGHDTRDELGSIAAPVLVIGGADDVASAPEITRTLADAIPGASYELLDDAGHLLNLEHPQVVAELILDHLLDATARRSASTAEPGDLHAEGTRVRRAVLGDDHVDAAAAASPFTRDFQDFITRHAWGAVWTRPGLTRRQRSMLTVALLTALGRDHELALHVRAAVRNGLSSDELSEVLLHTAVYAGVPAANAAFAVADEVLSDIATEGPRPSGR